MLFFNTAAIILHNRLLCLCLETHLSLRSPGPGLSDLDNGPGLKGDLSLCGPSIILVISICPESFSTTASSGASRPTSLCCPHHASAGARSQ